MSFYSSKKCEKKIIPLSVCVWKMNCPDKGSGDAVAIVAINRDVITREFALNQAERRFSTLRAFPF